MNRLAQVVLVLIVIAAVFVAAMITLATPLKQDRESLYQAGSLDDLMGGSYNGIASVGDIISHGDIGLGTFDGLDGEMIVLDGKCYKVRADGTVQLISADETTPFAQVSRFDVDGTIDLQGHLNLSDAEGQIEAALPTSNAFYLIKITGTFDNITVRSVPKQAPPYPPLADVVGNQTVFHYRGIEGTLVGLWSPSDTSGLSSAEFHFHFLSSDRTKGGHVLNLDLTDLRAEWDLTSRYVVDLE
ncbi:MAG: Alpha-acetolactate decarboxylase [Methanomassiliicoccales archaeon PtaU1.Bin030]|nr:MAG: Alpha-acetolactate decarboxylase [Methanomassiliicoccales archaeon PtaU1.Bin030]